MVIRLSTLFTPHSHLICLKRLKNPYFEMLFLILFCCLSMKGSDGAALNSTEVNATQVPRVDSSSPNNDVTLMMPETTTNPIAVAGILGCSWPADFVVRYKFCIKEAELGDFVAEEVGMDVRNGLLEPTVMEHLLHSEDCTSGNLEECIEKIDGKKMAEFINRWKGSAGKFQKFESCLQKNTEAMNRMCGTDTQLSKVVSGAAGLHLNILNILVRVAQSTETTSNMTEECWERIADAAHITTALYVKADRFMENAVLCWNVIHRGCEKECSVYAKELACMHAACPNVRPSMFQEFGIWQWYFLNADLVRKECKIEDKECAAGTLGPALPSEAEGAGSLFNMKTIKAKLHNVQVQLETTFQLPFYILLGIALSIFVAFAASITLICMWKHGLLGKKGKSKSRYSRLLTDGGKDESRSLTAHAVDDME